MKKPTDRQWNDFVKTYIDTESEDSNVKADFSVICKKMAVAYFDYLKAMWVACKDYMTEEEFCRINGKVEKKFFEEKIKVAENDYIKEENGDKICFTEKA